MRGQKFKHTENRKTIMNANDFHDLFRDMQLVHDSGLHAHRAEYKSTEERKKHFNLSIQTSASLGILGAIALGLHLLSSDVTSSQPSNAETHSISIVPFRDHAESPSGSICHICSDTMTPDENVANPQCCRVHYLHVNCMRRCLRSNNRCPFCRANVRM